MDLDDPPDLRGRDLTAGPLDLRPPPDLSPPPACATDGGTGGTLVLAAVGAGSALHVATFQTGWSGFAVDAPVVPLADVVLGAGPTLVARKTDQGLVSAPWVPAMSRFGTLTAVSTATSTHRPALAGGAMPDVVFKGANNSNVYHTLYTGTWSAPAVQSTFLTSVEPAIFRIGTTVHVIFKSFNSNDLYAATLGNAAAIIPGAASPHAPQAVATADGTTYLVFTGDNKKLYVATRPSGGAFGAAAELCSGCTSNFRPVVALDAAGAPLIAFRSEDTRVHTASLGGASQQASDGSDTTTYSPSLAPGLPGARAELVYVRAGGQPVHVRLCGGAWVSPTSIAGATVSAAPALITHP